MNLRPSWLPVATAFGVAASALCVTDASAHVKWFCAYDIAGQPRNLENVLCANFEELVGVSILALLFGCFVEGTPLGEAIQRAFNRVTAVVRDNTEMLFRAGGAF